MAPRRDAAAPASARLATDPAEARPSTAADEEDDDYDKLNPTLRVCWQYGGLVLGLLAIGGIVFPFMFEDWDPHPMWSVPFMLLLLGALAVHETRPYKNTDTLDWRGSTVPGQPAGTRAPAAASSQPTAGVKKDK